MDYKRAKIPHHAVTRDIRELMEPTGNIYETVAILSIRANQISRDIKEELNGKLAEFSVPNDNLEEVFENREQIEIARYHEHIPKPTLIAIKEFLSGDVAFRYPEVSDRE
ncbi:DNA-directed RNA polymerase subunit omega [Lentimicrobium sp.]